MTATTFRVSICVLVVLSSSAMRADERKAWHFTESGKKIVLYHAREGEWEDIRPDDDDRDYIYDELDRTDEFIEVRNRTTKTILRLHADRGYWRRDPDPEWKRWVNGTWGEIPAAAHLAKPQKSAATPADPAPKHPAPADPAPADSRESHEPRDYVVRLAYFVPQDRTPLPRYEDRIRVVMAYAASLYRNDLQRRGFKTEGIRFELNENLPVVHLVRGERPASYYNCAPTYHDAEQWNRIVPEIDAALGDRRKNVYVVFAETYEEGPAEYLWPGAMAVGKRYGAEGGMGIYTSHVLRDEFCCFNIVDQRRYFFDRTPIVGRRGLGQPPNTPRCEFVEDGFGAVMHELGHALGLPHDRRDERRYIMGNGFRHIRENLTGRGRVGFSDENSWLLMSSRYIAQDLDTSDNEPPKIIDAALAGVAGNAVLNVKASDNTGLRAFVVFDENVGSIIGGRRLEGKEVEFELRVPATASFGEAKLRLILTDDGGHQTVVTKIFSAAR